MIPPGTSASDVADLEAWINLGMGLPPAMDFTNRDHLIALCTALERLAKWVPALLLCLEGAEPAGVVEDMRDDLAEAQNLAATAGEERREMFDDNEKTIAENVELSAKLRDAESARDANAILVDELRANLEAVQAKVEALGGEP